MEQTSLFILFIFLVASSIILRKSKQARKKLPPGPWPLPVIGNLHQLDHDRLHRSLLALSRRHGPLMFLRLGAVPTLVVSSSEVAEEIFRRHDLTFSGRPRLAASRKLLYNDSSISFSSYGDHWKQARKISTTELFSSRQVRAFRAVREREVANLVAAISATDQKLSASTSSANLSELTLSFANNIVCGASFGTKHGNGGYGGEVAAQLYEVLSEVQLMFGSFIVEDLFPGMAWVDALRGLHGKLDKNFEYMDKFYDEAIGKQMKKGELEDNGDDEENLLQVLLRLHKVAVSTHGGFLSRMDHVKSILAEMFIAGTETASITTTWTMTELMRNPRVMSKVQRELQQMFGSKCNRLIEESEVEKLEYLKLVVKESLRLHPPAPLLLPRETMEPCTIRGFEIAAKTRVLINAVAISTDPGVWERPLEFWPERFEDRSVDFRGQDFEFIPFGAGRRICPGMSFGVAVIELALANLLHCFDWAMPDGMKAEDIDMEETVGISVRKKVPLRLVAKSKW